ncbi:hypothetical protein HN958_04085 [Candidatus Falkowbacteria bacterium]|jgi:hypothetical protein|nr:hypothetical protein [Candidatus Falkowbacteria bacterium]MBT7007656.1 hypothetical protein [Candidatus Falkowbacteria bacterium]
MSNNIYSDKNKDRQFKFSYWYVSNRVLLRRIFIAVLGLVALFFIVYGLRGLITTFISEKYENEQVYNALLEDNLNQDVIAEVSQAKDLIIKDTKMIATSRGEFDIVGQIENPNQTWVVEQFDYYFEFGDNRTTTKTDFVLPGQKKVLTEIGFSTEKLSNNVDVVIVDVKWKKVSNFEPLAEKMLQFDYQNVVINKSVTEKEGEKLEVTFLEFDIINKSSYNYWSPKFYVLIYNENNLIGVRQVVLDSISSSEIVEKSLAIYNSLPTKSQIQIVEDINILDPEVIKGFGNGSGELK